MCPALEQLLTTIEPHWSMVKDLIHGGVEDRMEIAHALFDEGILATMLVETPDHIACRLGRGLVDCGHLRSEM